MTVSPSLPFMFLVCVFKGWAEAGGSTQLLQTVRP